MPMIFPQILLLLLLPWRERAVMTNLCMMAATASLLALLISLYLRTISSDLSFFLGVRKSVIIEKIVFFFLSTKCFLLYSVK